MPSRKEGFGLAGLEAIVAGVPLLVSSESGLALLLKQSLPDEDWKRLVVPVRNDPTTDRANWATALAALLQDRQTAFDHAERVREILATRFSWLETAQALAKNLERKIVA